MPKIYTKTILTLLFISILFPAIPASADLQDDIISYDRYELYLKYQKKARYSKYKQFAKVKEKYGLTDAKKRVEAKDGYEKYKLFKKNPIQYRANAKYYEQYKAYRNYSELKGYAKYKKYKKYDKKSYNAGKNYKGYKVGHDRYIAFSRDIVNVTTNLGPQIKAGLWSKNISDAQSDPFNLTASKAMKVTDCASTTIGTIPVGKNVRVTYVPDDLDALPEDQGMLRVYNSENIIPQTDIVQNICFEADDGNNTDMIIDVNTPDLPSGKGSYDNYRGKIKIQHSFTQSNYDLYYASDFVDKDTANARRRIWVINILPLEQYMWGYGEMRGGVENHSKALIVTARSYARWWMEYASKWDDEGFDIAAYAYTNQIYHGYDYETAWPLVPEAAKATNGIFMKYGSDYVLGAYCSNTDGNTKSYPGTDHPYLISVPDPYGKVDNPGPGNHMWGLSAGGSVVLAQNYGWAWTKILSYYFTDISVLKEY